MKTIPVDFGPVAVAPRRGVSTPGVWAVALIALALGCLGRASGAEAATPADPAEADDPRVAAILMVEGKVRCLVAGVEKPATVGLQLPQGATLITERNAEAVVFFRQIGTMIRLRPATTIRLDKLTKFMRDGVLLKETLIDLQRGELMCVVRVLAEESKFEIRIPGHALAFDGAGMGRFDINARGTVLVGRKSQRPLRVVVGEDAAGAVLVAPGHAFSTVSGRVEPASDRLLDQVRPKLDELQSLAKALTPPPRAVELPRSRRTRTP